MAQVAQARQEIEAVLIAKAQAEPAFRQALLNNPKAALESEFGVALPPGRELKVVEETATVNYLVLPAAVGDELSEAELEAVAGGTSVFAALYAFVLQASIANESLRTAAQNAEADKLIVTRSRTVKYP